MTLDLADDKGCIGCGSLNPQGLKMQFDYCQKGILRSEVVFRKEHQGFKDLVHGGMVGLVLDEVMVNLAWRENLPAVTAELTVRLKKPVKVGQKVLLEARLDRQEERILYIMADARDEKGQILATAKASCIRVPGMKTS